VCYYRFETSSIEYTILLEWSISFYLKGKIKKYVKEMCKI